MTGNARYDGKPLLRLLELYVLRAIGELPESSETNLTAMAPKLTALYGGREWHEAVAHSIGLKPEAAALIPAVWIRNQEIAKTNGVSLSPQQFAEMFVDENFAPS